MARKPRPYIPGIIVLREKHGTSYYWALTREERNASALEILTSRWNNGNSHYYYDPFKHKNNAPKPELTLEQANALPEGKIKQMALKEHNLSKHRSRQQLEAEEQYLEIKQAVEDKDGQLAWSALSWRGDYEYEGFTVEHLEGGPATLKNLLKGDAPEELRTWIEGA